MPSVNVPSGWGRVHRGAVPRLQFSAFLVGRSLGGSRKAWGGFEVSARPGGWKARGLETLGVGGALGTPRRRWGVREPLLQGGWGSAGRSSHIENALFAGRCITGNGRVVGGFPRMVINWGGNHSFPGAAGRHIGRLTRLCERQKRQEVLGRQVSFRSKPLFDGPRAPAPSSSSAGFPRPPNLSAVCGEFGC